MEQATASLVRSHPPDISPPDLKVSLVPQFELARVWPQVGPLLQEAADMSEGRFILEDIRQRLVQGEWHLWIVFEPDLNIVAAITSSFTWYPRGKWLSGQFLGGSYLAEWRDKFCNIFDRWAHDNNCVAIEFTGRPGWARALAPNGYREKFRVYQRDLNNG